jgi:hypothetical protein
MADRLRRAAALTVVGAWLVVGGCVSTSPSNPGASGMGGGSGSGGVTAGGGASVVLCVPGRQLACGCVDGTEGAQVCKRDGSGYLPCTCAAAGAAGVDMSGAGGMANGEDGGANASVGGVSGSAGASAGASASGGASGSTAGTGAAGIGGSGAVAGAGPSGGVSGSDGGNGTGAAGTAGGGGAFAGAGGTAGSGAMAGVTASGGVSGSTGSGGGGDTGTSGGGGTECAAGCPVPTPTDGCFTWGLGCWCNADATASDAGNPGHQACLGFGGTPGGACPANQPEGGSMGPPGPARCLYAPGVLCVVYAGAIGGRWSCTQAADSSTSSLCPVTPPADGDASSQQLALCVWPTRQCYSTIVSGFWKCD